MGRRRPTRKPRADADGERKHDNMSRSRVHDIHRRADNGTKEHGIQVRTLSTEVDQCFPGRNQLAKNQANAQMKNLSADLRAGRPHLHWIEATERRSEDLATQFKQGRTDAERESAWGHPTSKRQLETKKERAWPGFLWTRMKTGHAKQREQELQVDKILRHINPRVGPICTERPKGK
jgi:hypothetical protein